MVAALAVWVGACSGGASDCREAAHACAAGFVCQEGPGGWSCLPVGQGQPVETDPASNVSMPVEPEPVDLYAVHERSIRQGVRAAVGLSSGTTRAEAIWRAAAQRWYQGNGGVGLAARAEGSYHENPHVAGREQLVDNVELRMAGYTADDSDVRRRSIEVGGHMNMRELQTAFQQLLRERNPALRDFGRTLERLHRLRRVTRTRGGMGAGKDQVRMVRAVLDIRVNPESRRDDEAALRGTVNFMSSHLAAQLRQAARRMQIASSVTGIAPPDAELSALTSRLFRAIRQGRDSGYAALETLVVTQSAN